MPDLPNAFWFVAQSWVEAGESQVSISRQQLALLLALDAGHPVSWAAVVAANAQEFVQQHEGGQVTLSDSGTQALQRLSAKKRILDERCVTKLAQRLDTFLPEARQRYQEIKTLLDHLDADQCASLPGVCPYPDQVNSFRYEREIGYLKNPEAREPGDPLLERVWVEYLSALMRKHIDGADQQRRICLLVDTNVLIDLSTPKRPDYEHLRSAWRAIRLGQEQGWLSVYISTDTLVELQGVLEKAGALANRLAVQFFRSGAGAQCPPDVAPEDYESFLPLVKELLSLTSGPSFADQLTAKTLQVLGRPVATTTIDETWHPRLLDPARHVAHSDLASWKDAAKARTDISRHDYLLVRLADYLTDSLYLARTDIHDAVRFVARLRSATSGLEGYLRGRLPKALVNRLETQEAPETLLDDLLAEINRLSRRELFYDEHRCRGISLDKAFLTMISRIRAQLGPEQAASPLLAVANVRLLEYAFRDSITTRLRASEDGSWHVWTNHRALAEHADEIAPSHRSLVRRGADVLLLHTRLLDVEARSAIREAVRQLMASPQSRAVESFVEQLHDTIVRAPGGAEQVLRSLSPLANKVRLPKALLDADGGCKSASWCDLTMDVFKSCGGHDTAPARVFSVSDQSMRTRWYLPVHGITHADLPWALSQYNAAPGGASLASVGTGPVPSLEKFAAQAQFRELTTTRVVPAIMLDLRELRAPLEELSVRLHQAQAAPLQGPPLLDDGFLSQLLSAIKIDVERFKSHVPDLLSTKNHLVILHTGWADAYLPTSPQDLSGGQAELNHPWLIHPWVTEDLAARLRLAHPWAVACDCPMLDCPLYICDRKSSRPAVRRAIQEILPDASFQDMEQPLHRAILGTGGCLLENLHIRDDDWPLGYGARYTEALITFSPTSTLMDGAICQIMVRRDGR